MANKPKIYGTCAAGCLWETVHYSDFVQSASLRKIEHNGNLLLEKKHRYRLFKNDTTVDFFGFSVALSLYSDEETESVGSITIPNDQWLDYVEFQPLGVEITDETVVAHYIINGERKTKIFTRDDRVDNATSDSWHVQSITGDAYEINTGDIIISHENNGDGTGITEEQAAQIEQNKADIAENAQAISELETDINTLSNLSQDHAEAIADHKTRLSNCETEIGALSSEINGVNNSFEEFAQGTNATLNEHSVEISQLSSEKANNSDVATLANTVSEIDSALFERTNGTSIYDPETMYVPKVMLSLSDDLIGTVCIDKTSTWDGIVMSATTALVCEPNQRYVLIESDGTCSNAYSVGIYDVNGVLLKWYSSPSDTIIETPANAYYMRVCFANETQRTNLRSIQYYEDSKTFYGYTVGEYPRITEKFILKPTRKPTVIIMHDGGNYDNRAEILAEYGLHGTFCVNSDSIAYMDEEFKNLLTQGHDVALYGGLGTQPSTYVTGTDDKTTWYNYIKGGLDALAEKGVYLPTQYGCRGHKGSKYITEVCKELGFKYISCTYELHSGETMDDDTDIEWVSTYENDPDNALFSPSILSEDTAANRAFVDNAITNNYIVGLFTHNVEDTTTASYNLSTTAYRDILSYVKEKVAAGEIEALTMREFYNKYHDWDGRQRDHARAMGMGSYGMSGTSESTNTTETWTFELEDGSTVTKTVVIA